MVKDRYNVYNGYKEDYASKILNIEQKTNEEDELEILENFLVRLQYDDYEILDNDVQPGPDFIICFQNALKIGCEITRYYSDKFGKQFYKSWKDFAAELKKN